MSLENLFSPKGRVALITGSSTGLGKAPAVFLASNSASFSTGQNIAVNGGMTVA